MSKVDEKRRAQTNVRLPPALLAELQEIAKREGRTQSAIIETALVEYLQRRSGPQLPDELVRAVEDYLARHR